MYNTKLPHIQHPSTEPEEKFISVEHEMAKAYAQTHPDVVAPEPIEKKSNAKTATD
jgi:hypothetical protein